MKRIVLLAIACSSVAIFLANEVYTPAGSSPLAGLETDISMLHPGLRNIATRAYSPTIMDPVVFANLWRSWDTPSRDAAEKASDKVRRQMTLQRYGLLEAPYNNGGAPLGFLVKKDGSYAMN